MRMTPVLNRLMRFGLVGGTAAAVHIVMLLLDPWKSLSLAIPRLCRAELTTNRRFAGVLLSGSMFGTAFRRCWETAYSSSSLDRASQPVLLIHPAQRHSEAGKHQAAFQQSVAFFSSTNRQKEWASAQQLSALMQGSNNEVRASFHIDIDPADVLDQHRSNTASVGVVQPHQHRGLLAEVADELQQRDGLIDMAPLLITNHSKRGIRRSVINQQKMAHIRQGRNPLQKGADHRGFVEAGRHHPHLLAAFITRSALLGTVELPARS